MANGTINQPGAKQFLFTLPAGATLAITPSSSRTGYSFLACASGVRAGVNSALYYCTGFSTNARYHINNTIISGSAVTIENSGSSIVITNGHSSDTVRVGIIITALWEGELNFEVSA